MKLPTEEIIRAAKLSKCNRYRYLLWRTWDHLDLMPKPTMFIGMLNPSTADSVKDDQTVRKLYGFCLRLGFGSFCIWNLYAGRARHPRDLFEMQDPVGPDNDSIIRNILLEIANHRPGIDLQHKLVLAWGNNARYERENEVLVMIREFGVKPYCWGVTDKLKPRHPVMIGYERKLVPYVL